MNPKSMNESEDPESTRDIPTSHDPVHIMFVCHWVAHR